MARPTISLKKIGAGPIQERFCQPLQVEVDLATMPLTRRHFLKVSSVGLFSVAGGLPSNADSVQLPSSPDTFGQGLRLLPRIIVMGVGGAGGSVLSALMKHRLPGVIHTSVHTDERALKVHEADFKILIGQRTDSVVAQGPSMGGEPSKRVGTKSERSWKGLTLCWCSEVWAEEPPLGPLR